MLVEHHREKLINAIIYFLKNTQKCGKTKLFKLLYFLDFYHFKETGKSVTNLEYFAWGLGPVPREFYGELSVPPPDLERAIFIPKNTDRSFVKMGAKENFQNKYFSKRESRILESVSFIFKEAEAKDMVESTHLPNEPWDKTMRNLGKGNKIDYMLALDNSSESLSKEEVQQIIKDSEEIKKIFHG